MSKSSKNVHKPDAIKESDRTRSIDVGGHIGILHLRNAGAPRHELRIDREGRWFHEGVEIAREDIRNYFSRHLIRNEDGGYAVRTDDDECPVVVEDAPFVVVRVEESPSDGLSILLNDGGRVPLEPRTLEFRRSNVPYCRVRGGLDARFSRPAYYQLSEFIEHDEETNRFRLVFDGRIVDLDIT